MVPTEQRSGAANRYDRFFRRIEDTLVPYIGSANVGPYDADVHELAQDDSCPICGYVMAEHSFDRSTDNAVLNCPVEVKPVANDTAPLNELGMPTESARTRAAKHDART